MKSNELNKQSLLESKGFKLNVYPEGAFWELTIDSEEAKIEILETFQVGYELTETGINVDIAILQCDSSLENCVLCCDTEVWNLTPEEFFKGIEQL